MKLSLYLTGVLAGTALTFPGMGDLMRKLAERQASGAPPVEMIGDLVQGATTPVGNQVKNCLLGSGPCQDLTPKVRISLSHLKKTMLTFFKDIQSSRTAQSLLSSRHMLRVGLHIKRPRRNVHQLGWDLQ